ncbi:S41 family peptidase [Vibrio crassostreae]|uniref:S41 family peptidase n=1 Tax=Vibrio crassostreae TaxID=246167 RepID=UPI001B3011C6|nr:S41 family peptidase [Vibrio crassostreae]
MKKNFALTLLAIFFTPFCLAGSMGVFTEPPETEDLQIALARLAVFEYKTTDLERSKSLNSVKKSLGIQSETPASLSELDYVEGALSLLSVHNVTPEKLLTAAFKESLSERSRLIGKTDHTFVENRFFTAKDDGQVFKIGDMVEPNCETPSVTAKSITIDLRDSAGGSILCAENIAKKLLSSTNHTYSISSNSRVERRTIEGELKKEINNKTVIVGGKTASSSELLAWLLVEDGYELTGEVTYGKNSTQGHFSGRGFSYLINYGEFKTRLCNVSNCKLSPSKY